MNVLVVEDDAAARVMLETALRLRGHEVVSCEDAESAWECCGRLTFDLAVLDWLLPGMDGLELCRRIRATPWGGRVFILLVTQRDRPEDLRVVLDVGVDDYIAKPVSPAVLEVRFAVAEHQLANLVERRRSEEALREREEQYRVLFDSTPDGILVADVESRTLRYANPAMCRLLGYEPEELTSLEVADIHPREALDRVQREFATFADRPHHGTVLLPCRRQDGEIIQAEVSATPVVLDQRRCLMGFFRDVTNRLRAEQELQKAHDELEARVAERTAELAEVNEELRAEIAERLRAETEVRELKDFSESIVESMSEGVLLTDLDRKIVFVNRAAAEMYGCRPEELIGQPSTRAVPPDQMPAVAAAWERRSRGEVDRYELELLHRDGHRVPVLVSGTPRYQDGRVVGTMGVLTSLAELRRVEADRDLLSAAVEQATESVVITDTDGTIRYVNPAFERITGFTREQAIGENPRILKSGRHDDAFYQRMWRTLLQGEVWSGQLVNRRADGELFEWDTTIFPVRDAAARVSNYVGVMRDMTGERALERQLWQAQKMEAIGQLAGCIAHDFNNLNQVIMGTTELLRHRLASEGSSAEALDVILRTARSAAELTRGLLDFSRHQVLEPAELDLNQLIAGMMKALLGVLPDNISLQHVPGRDLCAVRADRGRMEQVLVNLCVNARDAMPEGGAIVIETGNRDIGPEYVSDHPWAREGRHVYFSVRDSGCGMDEATRARVFDPFFTTKAPGQGTGLGLAAVYGIVKQHGGMIDIASQVGEGACVWVYLPAAVETAQPAEQTMAEARVEGGRERVLVVEDNEDLREIIVEYLETVGYQVACAEDGVQALGILRAAEDPFELVITDMTMPRMGGRELFERAREVRPEIAFLFCTGYAPDWRELERVGDRRTARIEKPFDLETLGRRLAELLTR